MSALTGKVLYDPPALPGATDTPFLPIQDLDDGDYVLYPRVAVFKIRATTGGAPGIYVFRWGLAALSDKPSSAFISKIYDDTNCDIYAPTIGSTTLILVPHGAAYILEYENLAAADSIPHWEYGTPHFICKYGARDPFLNDWWAACALADAETAFCNSIDCPLSKANFRSSALQQMPEVPTEILTPRNFMGPAVERYPHVLQDTKVIVECNYVYVLEFDASKSQLTISFGFVGQTWEFTRAGPLSCVAHIRRATCRNFGRGCSSALFLVPTRSSALVVHLTPAGNLERTASSYTIPTRLVRDHNQGITTDVFRVCHADPDTYVCNVD